MGKEKALEALDRIFNNCEEIDWHIPEDERTGYKMLPDIRIVRDYILHSNPTNRCGTCKHYIGGGDWNLCCSIKHPTPKEKEMGMTFTFGHLCYKGTNACDMYEPKGENYANENCPSQ